MLQKDHVHYLNEYVNKQEEDIKNEVGTVVEEIVIMEMISESVKDHANEA